LVQFRHALTLKKDDVRVMNEMAWILATDPNPQLRNGEEALRLARRACELTRNANPAYLDTLAAANAEAGKFEEAIEVTKRLREKARAMGKTTLVAETESRLALYRLHMAYHTAEK
jgi:tetratricopeptide (TPR) repeat protein